MAQCGHAGEHIIPVHQQTTEATTSTITATGLSEAHQCAIFATSDQGITAKVQKDYHVWLGRLINFIFTDYPDIFEDAALIISQEQKDDPVMYYYP